MPHSASAKRSALLSIESARAGGALHRRPELSSVRNAMPRRSLGMLAVSCCACAMSCAADELAAGELTAAAVVDALGAGADEIGGPFDFTRVPAIELRITPEDRAMLPRLAKDPATENTYVPGEVIIDG